MNRQLADAIVGTFHLQSADEHFVEMASFPPKAWVDTYRWLDAHGLALYFLDRVQSLRQQAVLPAAVLRRLEQNVADNRERTADTFAEFVRLNRTLTAAGVTFVNVKGISLVPNACSDPALRLQLDLDVVIEMRQVQTCAVALGEMGYVLAGICGHVWEFKAGATTMPSVDDLYKAKPQRDVEIHCETGHLPNALALRREWSEWQGFTFPVLNSVERFIAQAAHVLKHIRGEWTRLSWLLEFRHSVLHWKDDASFWREVREQAANSKEVQTAIGAAIMLTTIAFGDFAPEELTAWTVDGLERPMRMWLLRYGREAIMADFPGTKLYLLQPEAVSEGGKSKARAKRIRLLPLHRSQRVLHGAQPAGMRARGRAWLAQTKHMLFRMRFHFREGLRYMEEAPRWRKIVVAAQQPHSTLVAADERGLS